MKQQQGISLVELMISSTLGLVIISIAVASYLNIKQSYHWHQALAQIQTTGQLATQLISDDIRHANKVSAVSKDVTLIKRLKANTDYLFLENQNLSQKTIYFIDQSSYKDSHAIAIDELNKKELLQKAHLQDGMLLGISNMQIRYGILSASGVDFLKAEDIIDWNKVKLVQVNLLLDSIISVFSSLHHYQFLNKYYLAKDLQLHKQWTFVARLGT